MLIDPPAHESFSPGARPDVAVKRGAPDGLHWLLLEVKVASPVATGKTETLPDGAFAAFANTAPPLRRDILDGHGDTPAKYAGASAKGHHVVPCIFEVFGGAELDAVAFLERLGKRARGKTPPGEEPPWSARNFVPYYSQLLSKEVQRGVADEILHRAREEIMAREARLARD